MGRCPTFNEEDITFNYENIVVETTTPLILGRSSDINSNSLANGLPVIIDNAWVTSYTNMTPVSFSNDEAMVSLSAVVGGPEGN